MFLAKICVDQNFDLVLKIKQFMGAFQPWQIFHLFICAANLAFCGSIISHY